MTLRSRRPVPGPQLSAQKAVSYYCYWYFPQAKNHLCFESFNTCMYYLPLEKLTVLRISSVHMINSIIYLLVLQLTNSRVMTDQAKGGRIFTLFLNQIFL